MDSAAKSSALVDQRRDPNASIHWHPDGYWLVTRYRDVRAILLDARFGHLSDARAPINEPRSPGWFRKLWSKQADRAARELELIPLLQSHSLAHTNPPEHTRLRGLITEALNAGRMNSLGSHIRARANELIDHVKAQGTMDVVADFAQPLSMVTINELLDIPRADAAIFMQHLTPGQRLFTFLGTNDAQEIRQIEKHAIALISLLRELIAVRRRAPGDDLISALISAGNGMNSLNEEQLLSNLILLVSAGHETTYQLVTNVMWELLQLPDALAQVKAEQDRRSIILQELLRYCCPVQFTTRVALEDVDWNDKIIRQGQKIRLALATANRDEEQFVNGHELDFTRRNNPHLTFGAGIHNCLGAPLARIEATIALDVLFKRLPSLNLQTTQVAWRESNHRSPRELWVTF